MNMNKVKKAVLDHIHDGYTEIACFGTADIVWVEAYQSWLLVATDDQGTQYWRGPENHAGSLLNYIDDDEILDFYQENLADQEEEE